jgi:hypothetical protein
MRDQAEEANAMGMRTSRNAPRLRFIGDLELFFGHERPKGLSLNN